MNTSINEALSRTILTGGATLIPLICLFLVGGSVLRDFALAILIGLLVGTYSSIFIASPVVLRWNKARGGSTHTLRREVTEAVTAAKPTAAPLGACRTLAFWVENRSFFDLFDHQNYLAKKQNDL